MWCLPLCTRNLSLAVSGARQRGVRTRQSWAGSCSSGRSSGWACCSSAPAAGSGTAQRRGLRRQLRHAPRTRTLPRRARAEHGAGQHRTLRRRKRLHCAYLRASGIYTGYILPRSVASSRAQLAIRTWAIADGGGTLRSARLALAARTRTACRCAWAARPWACPGRAPRRTAPQRAPRCGWQRRRPAARCPGPGGSARPAPRTRTRQQSGSRGTATAASCR